MNIFEILGPVMVGPSSSHTAGAVKIGYISQALLGTTPVTAEILLHGSFASTGIGHGTDKALIAGLLGMSPDNTKITDSFEIAKNKGMNFSISTTQLTDAHPNTAVLKLKSKTGKQMEIVGSSLGGGRIVISKVDDIKTNITGELPTLIITNIDQPGHLAEVASILCDKSINIASLNLYRTSRGGHAVMVIEIDQVVSEQTIKWLKSLDGVLEVVYLDATQ